MYELHGLVTLVVVLLSALPVRQVDALDGPDPPSSEANPKPPGFRDELYLCYVEIMTRARKQYINQIFNTFEFRYTLSLMFRRASRKILGYAMQLRPAIRFCTLKTSHFEVFLWVWQGTPIWHLFGNYYSPIHLLS